MSHFARVKNGKVLKVIVAEQDFIDNHNWIDEGPGRWIQCSYNTFGGKHYKPDSREEDSGTPLRYNFPGIGWNYDIDKEAFYAPQPYPSWKLNTSTYLWEAPSARPTDGFLYYWDEPTTSWKKIEEIT